MFSEERAQMYKVANIYQSQGNLFILACALRYCKFGGDASRIEGPFTKHYFTVRYVA